METTLPLCLTPSIDTQRSTKPLYSQVLALPKPTDHRTDSSANRFLHNRPSSLKLHTSSGLGNGHSFHRQEWPYRDRIPERPIAPTLNVRLPTDHPPTSPVPQHSALPSHTLPITSPQRISHTSSASQTPTRKDLNSATTTTAKDQSTV